MTWSTNINEVFLREDFHDDLWSDLIAFDIHNHDWDNKYYSYSMNLLKVIDRSLHIMMKLDDTKNKANSLKNRFIVN